MVAEETETALIRSLADAFTNVAGLDDLLARLMQNGAASTRSTTYLIASYSPETGQLVTVSTSDQERLGDWTLAVTDHQPPSEGEMIAAIASRHNGPIRALAICGPDTGQRRLLGMIAFGRPRRLGRYTPKECATLDLLAGIAGLAISRFRTEMDFSRLTGEHEMVAHLVGRIWSAQGADSLYQSAVDTVLAAMGLNGCALFIGDGERPGIACVACRGDAPPKGFRLNVPRRASGADMRPDIVMDALATAWTSSARDLPLFVTAAGPGATLVGVGSPARAFTEAEHGLYRLLAGSIGAAVESEIAARMERDRLRRTEQLLRLARTVGSQTGLDATLDSISVETGRLLGADCISAFTIPKDGGEPHVGRMSVTSMGKVCGCKTELPDPVGYQDVARLASGRPMILDPNELSWSGLGCVAQAALLAPLDADGKISGGILFRWHRETNIPESTLDFVGAIAEICALAVEKARLFEDLLLEKKVMEVMNNELGRARDETARKAFELMQLNSRIEQNNRLLAEANMRLEEMADRDGMTGVANHRRFQERLREESARAIRHGERISVIMIDVDHFKQYNDAFGHPAGDKVLQIVAKTIEDATRPFDTVARYGGEEFAVVLPRTGRRAARAVAERIRVAITATEFPRRLITASLGISTMPSDAVSAEEMIDHADQALYVAKARGRNCTISWTFSASKLRAA